MFATYARNNAGNVTVQLYDKTDNYKMIYAESFLASQLLDNTYRDFQIDVQPDSQLITLHFISDIALCILSKKSFQVYTKLPRKLIKHSMFYLCY